VCDVPSVAVFCGETAECFPAVGYAFSLIIFLLCPVAPITTGTIITVDIPHSVPHSSISQVTVCPSNCTKMSEYVAILLHVSAFFSNDQLYHRRATVQLINKC